MFFLVLLVLLAAHSHGLTGTERENQVLDEIVIDFKSKLYSQQSGSGLDRFLYTSEAADNEVSSSRLHSSQMNTSSLRKNFEIVNKTSVALVASSELTRRSLCSQLKSCDSKNAHICLLNLNLILYMSSRQVKLVNLGIILSDLSDDYLRFERTLYEFTVDTSISNEIGAVKAVSAKNSDLVSYFVSFKENKRELWANLVSIDDKTGHLSLNRSQLSVLGSFQPRRIEFFVDAFVQCSFGQAALHNQTRVRLTIIDSRDREPTFNVTYLWETKALKLGPRCVRMEQTELVMEQQPNGTREIALTQIQVDNLVDYDLDFAELDFKIDSFEPRQGPKLSLRHLVDNIFVLYLEKSSSPLENRFLNDLFRVNLKLSHTDGPSAFVDIYLCVNSISSFADELNMVQFESPVTTMTQSQGHIDLKAIKVGPFKSRIRFFLHPNDHQPTLFQLEPLENDQIRFSSSPVVDRDDHPLIREAILVAYDEIRFPDFNQHHFEAIRRLAAGHGNRELHFSTRIRVLYDSETSSTSSIEILDDVFKFHVPFADLLNNSVVGYLPSIWELDLPSDETSTSLEYKLVQSNVDSTCFRISAFDGIVYFAASSRSCLTTHYPIKLSVELTKGRLFHVLIYDRVDSPVKAVNLAFAEGNLVENGLNFELNFNFVSSLESPPLDELLPLVNLVPSQLASPHHRIKFELGSKSNIFVLDTKMSRVFMRRDELVRENRINEAFLEGEESRCVRLDLVATEFAYSGWNRRKAVSEKSTLSTSVCFYASRSLNRTSSTTLLSPIDASALTSFEMLVKSRVAFSGRYIPMVWYFTLAVFSFIFTLLVLFLAYNTCTGKDAAAVVTSPSPSGVERRSNSAPNYDNFETKYSSTSSSYFDEDESGSFEKRHELRIRSDHPSLKTGESLGDGLDGLAENYGFLTSDDRQVPSKLDILLNKQPLQSRFLKELSSINIENETTEGTLGTSLQAGQSATGVSFASSNSHCIDAEVNAFCNLRVESTTLRDHTRFYEVAPNYVWTTRAEPGHVRLNQGPVEYSQVRLVSKRECIV